MVALFINFQALLLCLRLLALPTCVTKASSPHVVESQSIEPIEGCWVFGRNAKSGSSTIVVILEHWQKRYHVDCGAFKWHVWLRADERESFMAQNHTMVWGASTEALYALGSGGDCKWFTMFRHPISRLVSAFYFCKYKRPGDPTCGQGVLDVETADFATFAEFWNNFGIKHFVEAFVTPEEVMASPAVQAVDQKIPGWYKVGLYANELYANESTTSANDDDADVYDAAMYKFLQPAMDRLSSDYAAVGILEDFDNSMHLFNRALKIPHLDWVDMFRSLGAQNEGLEGIEDAKAETLRQAWTDPTIHKFLWLDMLLYDHSLSVYKKQLVEYGLVRVR